MKYFAWDGYSRPEYLGVYPSYDDAYKAARRYRWTGYTVYSEANLRDTVAMIETALKEGS